MAAGVDGASSISSVAALPCSLSTDEMLKLTTDVCLSGTPIPLDLPLRFLSPSVVIAGMSEHNKHPLAVELAGIQGVSAERRSVVKSLDEILEGMAGGEASAILYHARWPYHLIGDVRVTLPGGDCMFLTDILLRKALARVVRPSPRLREQFALEQWVPRWAELQDLFVFKAELLSSTSTSHMYSVRISEILERPDPLMKLHGEVKELLAGVTVLVRLEAIDTPVGVGSGCQLFGTACREYVRFAIGREVVCAVATRWKSTKAEMSDAPILEEEFQHFRGAILLKDVPPMPSFPEMELQQQVQVEHPLLSVRAAGFKYSLAAALAAQAGKVDGAMRPWCRVVAPEDFSLPRAVDLPACLLVRDCIKRGRREEEEEEEESEHRGDGPRNRCRWLPYEQPFAFERAVERSAPLKLCCSKLKLVGQKLSGHLHSLAAVPAAELAGSGASEQTLLRATALVRLCPVNDDGDGDDGDDGNDGNDGGDGGKPGQLEEWVNNDEVRAMAKKGNGEDREVATNQQADWYSVEVFLHVLPRSVAEVLEQEMQKRKADAGASADTDQDRGEDQEWDPPNWRAHAEWLGHQWSTEKLQKHRSEFASVFRTRAQINILFADVVGGRVALFGTAELEESGRSDAFEEILSIAGSLPPSAEPDRPAQTLPSNVRRMHSVFRDLGWAHYAMMTRMMHPTAGLVRTAKGKKLCIADPMLSRSVPESAKLRDVNYDRFPLHSRLFTRDRSPEPRLLKSDPPGKSVYVYPQAQMLSMHLWVVLLTASERVEDDPDGDKDSAYLEGVTWKKDPDPVHCPGEHNKRFLTFVLEHDKVHEHVYHVQKAPTVVPRRRFSDVRPLGKYGWRNYAQLTRLLTYHSLTEPPPTTHARDETLIPPCGVGPTDEDPMLELDYFRVEGARVVARREEMMQLGEGGEQTLHMFQTRLFNTGKMDRFQAHPALSHLPLLYKEKSLSRIPDILLNSKGKEPTGGRLANMFRSHSMQWISEQLQIEGGLDVHGSFCALLCPPLHRPAAISYTPHSSAFAGGLSLFKGGGSKGTQNLAELWEKRGDDGQGQLFHAILNMWTTQVLDLVTSHERLRGKNIKVRVDACRYGADMTVYAWHVPEGCGMRDLFSRTADLCVVVKMRGERKETPNPHFDPAVVKVEDQSGMKEQPQDEPGAYGSGGQASDGSGGSRSDDDSDSTG